MRVNNNPNVKFGNVSLKVAKITPDEEVRILNKFLNFKCNDALMACDFEKKTPTSARKAGNMSLNVSMDEQARIFTHSLEKEYEKYLKDLKKKSAKSIGSFTQFLDIKSKEFFTGFKIDKTNPNHDTITVLCPDKNNKFAENLLNLIVPSFKN